MKFKIIVDPPKLFINIVYFVWSMLGNHEEDI